MKKVLGGVLAALAGALFAYGIATLTGFVDCVVDCGVGGHVVPASIAASVMYVVAALLWRGAYVIAPIVGVVIGFGLSLLGGTELNRDTLGFGGFIAFTVLLGPLAVLAFWGYARRKQKVAANLVATGNKAVAHIQGVRQTSVYINNLPQLEVQYSIVPLDGTPPFPHTKKQTLSYGAPQPRLGLAWPAWYDPADPSTVAVGAPSGQALDPATEAQFAEFGLTLTQVYGFDPRTGQGPPSPTPPLPPSNF